VSKKKKQQEAVQRAQKYVSGNKLTKSEVKKLESKGFNSKQVRAVAGSMKTVGDKAQGRIDNKHAPGPSGSNSSGPSRVQTVGGTHRIRVDGQGRVNASTRLNYSPSGVFLTRDAAKKINTKVEKSGGSLTPGKGMAVSRYVTITDPGRRGQPKHGSGRIGGGKHQLAIYAPVAPAGGRSGSGKKDPGKKDPGKKNPATKDPVKRDPISVGGATGDYRTVEKLEQEAPKAPNFYDTANSFPVNPNYSPTGSGVAGSGGSANPIYWDRTAENLFSYTDRLGEHNRQTGQWLSDIGAADRRESDAYLQNFARALPPAPDPNEANESVLSFLEQANKRLGFG